MTRFYVFNTFDLEIRVSFYHLMVYKSWVGVVGHMCISNQLV